MATDALQPFDSSDWPSIMLAHRNWLASVVYARVKDSHAVEEVLQETALAASRQSCLADDEAGVFRWLYRVAVRQAILYRRRQYRCEQRTRVAGVQRANFKRSTTVSANPYRVLMASENRELVQEAMGQLDSRDCEILMLKYVDGWSCREIGDRLGVSVSAIKSRLLRSRKNLRRQLLMLEPDWELQ